MNGKESNGYFSSLTNARLSWPSGKEIGMAQYTIKTVQRRDEWRSKYARGSDNDMVDYALTFEEVEGFVRLSQKTTTPPPQEGATLNGSLEDSTGPDGQEYKRFRKDFGGAGQQPTLSTVDESLHVKVDQILRLVQQIAGYAGPEAKQEEEEVDLSDIPF